MDAGRHQQQQLNPDCADERQRARQRQHVETMGMMAVWNWVGVQWGFYLEGPLPFISILPLSILLHLPLTFFYSVYPCTRSLFLYLPLLFSPFYQLSPPLSFCSFIPFPPLFHCFFCSLFPSLPHFLHLFLPSSNSLPPYLALRLSVAPVSLLSHQGLLRSGLISCSSTANLIGARLFL